MSDPQFWNSEGKFYSSIGLASAFEGLAEWDTVRGRGLLPLEKSEGGWDMGQKHREAPCSTTNEYIYCSFLVRILNSNSFRDLYDMYVFFFQT